MGNKKYGCIGCEFESDNLEDFRYIEGDPFWYCIECLEGKGK